MKLSLLSICLTFITLLPTHGAESLSCELVMDSSIRQADLATGHLENIVKMYKKAEVAYQEDRLARALNYISQAETSLYQGRSYYVLALMRLDQASQTCPDTFDTEITTLQEILRSEIEELNLMEEKVLNFKETILK